MRSAIATSGSGSFDHLKIVVATPENEVEINKVLAASFSSLLTAKYDDILVAPILPRVTTVNPQLLNSGSYYIAKDDNNNIVGCGGWTHEKPGTSEVVTGEAHIRHFATDPAHIGKGIGKALFEHSKAAAKLENVDTLICYSTLNAELFYKSLGFETFKLFDLDMGDGLMFPSILMKAEI